MSPDTVAQDQIKAFVRRIEALEDEIKVLNEDKSEVYKEAKGNGFDTKVLRKVIAARRQDSNERAEQDALFQLYMEALEGVAHAHVEIIEEFDPETGEVGKPTTEIPGNGAGAAEAGVEVALVAPTSAETIPEPVGYHPADPLRSGAATRKDADTPAQGPAIVLQLRTYNPDTHFLSKDGLQRLHGCLNPEACASSQPRVKHCFSCSVKHDGPSPSGEVA